MSDYISGFWCGLVSGLAVQLLASGAVLAALFLRSRAKADEFEASFVLPPPFSGTDLDAEYDPVREW